MKLFIGLNAYIEVNKISILIIHNIKVLGVKHKQI